MIIYLFLCLWACASKSQIVNTTQKTFKENRIGLKEGQEAIDSAILQYSSQPSSVKVLNELSYLHWIKGLLLSTESDWHVARAKGVQCLSDEEIFSIEYLHSMDLIWKVDTDFWKKEHACSTDRVDDILGLSNEEVYLECATWTILSWSTLIGSYNLRYGSLDNAHILYLTSWLFKHQACTDNSWLRYAIALALAQSHDDQRIPFDHQVLRQLGFSQLHILFDDPLVGDFAFLSYIEFLVELDIEPQEDIESIIQKLDALSIKETTRKRAKLVRERFQSLH